jgi:hypothetical protein
MIVKSGAGAQTISGILTGNSGAGSGSGNVWLDGAIIAAGGASDGITNWSASIPDDGNRHVLVFQVTSNGPTTGLLSAWVPVDGTGGVDTTKFSFVGPDNANYT